MPVCYGVDKKRDHCFTIRDLEPRRCIEGVLLPSCTATWIL